MLICTCSKIGAGKGVPWSIGVRTVSRQSVCWRWCSYEPHYRLPKCKYYINFM